jgi:hypothetical protein
MKYAATRLMLTTVGRLSQGIRLGWRTGFDSGVMLEYIYENQPRGTTSLGRLIDKRFISHPVWDGVRSRRELLVRQLNEALKLYDHPILFDFAAGVGSYLFALPEGKATIIAGDYEMEAVQRGRAKATQLGRQDITFQKSNAFQWEALATHQAGILVCSGFFDILVREDEIRKVLENGSAIAEPGARWVFTIQEHHPDLQLLKETMIDFHKQSWELTPRSAEQLITWAQSYGWELETLERNDFFAVGTLVKC